MLVFIIPLKSPQVSKSWTTVCKLFERTVKSICNQTSKHFSVIVVCNETPKIGFSHPHITYIEVDLPLPESDYKSKELDRTRKVVTGLIYARELKPSHVMCVDADDCVSQHLAEYVNRHPQHNGWFIKKGYMYQDGSNLIRIMRKGFEQYCGTSNIIRYDCYNLHEALDEKEYTQFIYKNFTHREIKNTLAKQELIIEPLPFIGAIYIVGNTENIYYGVEDKNGKKTLKTRLLRIKILLDFRLLTKKIRDEFGLAKIS
ncbi:MAG: glycosyltransferase family 2 protein [Stigonema ocellatum SAG 48.90 = DSM 106950]|nr:glycosyltransferase family 2 protein [Stigonema ocellatum SAG 48.90 = DSM 106950]